MAAYKDLVGQKITKVTSNPGEPKTGQMWYNSTDGKLRGLGIISAYSSASSLGTGRRATGGTGTQTAALVCSGQVSHPTRTSATEEYNGTGYSAGGNTGTARYTMACGGTQTAAIISMGYATAALTATEEYNGSTWTSGTASNDNRTNLGSGGTQSSFLAFGGSESPGTSAATEEWDDSSWTTGGNLGTARYQLSGNNVGTQTAGLCIGGFSGSAKTENEEYNGSTWSAGGALPTAEGNAARGGTQTAAYISGGGPGPGPNTASKHYDGTSWTTAPSLAIGRSQISGSQATQTNHVVFGGGSSPTPFQASEEFNTSINTITAAAWASGGSLPGPISSTQGGGTQTAGIQMSGQPNAPGTAATTATNEYNGSTWSSGGALASGAASYGGQAAKNGTQTAMLYWKGHYAGNKNTVSSYDGSSWTAQSAFPNTIVYGAGSGISTAALEAGGYGPSPPYVQATTFESDASYNWTAGGTMGTGRYNADMTGPQTAAVTAGGQTPSNIAKTEEYDGTSWSEKSDMIIKSGITKNQTFGTNADDMMIAGGNPNTTSCIHWDGTAWETRPSISTGRHGGAGAGASGTSGWIAGGQSPFKNATEEFTGETTAVNIADFTTS